MPAIEDGSITGYDDRWPSCWIKLRVLGYNVRIARLTRI